MKNQLDVQEARILQTYHQLNADTCQSTPAEAIDAKKHVAIRLGKELHPEITDSEKLLQLGQQAIDSN
jgi:hypothetical protein